MTEPTAETSARSAFQSAGATTPARLGESASAQSAPESRTQPKRTRRRRKLILDLDTGIDDALAIVYALGSTDEVDLIGITGTYGNVTVERGVRNALAVLHLFGRDDVPVYPGVDHPLGYDPASRGPWRPSAGSVGVHAPNGLGGVDIPDSPRGPEAPGSAVDFIIDAVRTWGEDLIIVPTGAMTTMVTVLRKAPDVAAATAFPADASVAFANPAPVAAAGGRGVNITFMGGALTIPGNVSPVAEANISQDPEAADYLFKCGARTTMIGLDVTHQTVLTRDRAAAWGRLGTAAGDFLKAMTDYYIDFYLAHQPEIHGCGLHDPLAVAAAIDPSLIGTFGVNMQVDLDGATRGRTIGDRSRLQDPVKRTHVALSVDAPRFVDRFMRRTIAAASSAW